MNIYLSALLAPENLVSRGGFGSPVPRQPAHLHTRLDQVLTDGIPPEFRGGVHVKFFSLQPMSPPKLFDCSRGLAAFRFF